MASHESPYGEQIYEHEREHAAHESTPLTSDHDSIPKSQLIDKKLSIWVSPVDPVKEMNRQSSMPRELRAEDLEHMGWRNGRNHNVPEFVKHSGSTNYEMFFDLWFVASLSVYSDSHTTTDPTKLWTNLGYLCILWVSWFLVGLFDVRFVTDSLFERLARTAHLGVMVGFAIVGTKFDPNEQTKFAFQGLSLILMMSRLILTAQYASVVYHIRKFRHGAWAVGGVAILHFCCALIYLGITFRFRSGENSRVFIAWYVIAIGEALVNVSLGLYSKALSFNGTHLTERMTVLTLIILGEGVMSVAKNVVLIVKNDGWTSATIGVLISAIATVYMFFMIYFDWMNHHTLGNVRQILWSILHFPFHIGLLLFMEGASAFITFWKIQELERFASSSFQNALESMQTDPDAEATSYYVYEVLWNVTFGNIFQQYAITYTATETEVIRALDDIRDIPDDYWLITDPDPLDERVQTDIQDLLVTVVNSLFVNFKIDFFEDSTEPDDRLRQYEAYNKTNSRFILVWQYTYLSAGLVLIFLTTLFVICRQRGWTLFNYFRTGLFFALGALMCLVLLLSDDDKRGAAFLQSPWLLPTLCIVFLVVLLMTHLPSPPPLFFAKRAAGGSSSRSSAAYTTVYQVGRDAVSAQAAQGNPYVADTAYSATTYHEAKPHAI